MKVNKKMISIPLVAMSLLLLSGCDDAPKSKIKNPLAGHVNALKKANDVEKKLLDAAEQQRKAIDAMSD